MNMVRETIWRNAGERVASITVRIAGSPGYRTFVIKPGAVRAIPAEFDEQVATELPLIRQGAQVRPMEWVP